MTPSPATRAHTLVLVLLLGAAPLGACGASDASGSIAGDTTSSDTRPGVDVIASDTTQSTDTTAPADTAATDATAADTAAADTRPDDDTGSTVTTLTKDDPTFTVPAGVAERREVALSGAVAAWVERDTPGAAPRLVTWDTGAVDVAPVAHPVANLAHPRELALDGDHLVYVDDRYGDPDVFVLDLTTGQETAVSARAGAQTRPAVLGKRVAWQDCRRCVGGDGDHGADIYLFDLSTGVEINLTDDDTADRRPVFGTLASGAPAIAWVHAGGVLRASGLDDATDVVWQVAEVELGGLALTEGVFAWRQPSPFIINPDSMHPGDVFLTNAADGATFPATFHAERAPGLDEVPRGAGGRVSWLESPANDLGATRLRVAGVDATPLISTDLAARASSLALSATHAAITAPRPDNGGFEDVWILPVGP